MITNSNSNVHWQILHTKSGQEQKGKYVIIERVLNLKSEHFYLQLVLKNKIKCLFEL